MGSAHVRKPFHRLGEAFDGLVRVAVLDAVADAMLDVSLQHDLAAAVQGGFRRIDKSGTVFYNKTTSTGMEDAQ